MPITGNPDAGMLFPAVFARKIAAFPPENQPLRG